MRSLGMVGDYGKENGTGFKMAVSVAFQFLKIVVIREARNRNGVPQVGIYNFL